MASLSDAALDELERQVAAHGYLDGTEAGALIAEVRAGRRYAALCQRTVRTIREMARIAVETEQIKRQIAEDGGEDLPGTTDDGADADG